MPRQTEPVAGFLGHRACRAFDRGALPGADPTPPGNPYRALIHIADGRLEPSADLVPDATTIGKKKRAKWPSPDAQ